jgi:hypothetical protein
MTGEIVRIVRATHFGESLDVNKFQRIAWQGYADDRAEALKLASAIPCQVKAP